MADTENFIVIHPNGAPTGAVLAWNTADPANAVDDVGFISSMLDQLLKDYSIDSSRMYVTGMSNGGFMAFELACKLSNRIAAIASVAGSMTPNRLNMCKPLRPVPVMQIHGTNDKIVLYNGSAAGVNVNELLNFWINNNKCNPTAEVKQFANLDTLDKSLVQQYSFSDGLESSSVEHYKIIDGEHTWPGTKKILGVTNADINASVEIWRFLSQYSLTNKITNIEKNGDGKFIITQDFHKGLTIQCSSSLNNVEIQLSDVLEITYQLIRYLILTILLFQIQ